MPRIQNLHLVAVAVFSVLLCASCATVSSAKAPSALAGALQIERSYSGFTIPPMELLRECRREGHLSEPQRKRMAAAARIARHAQKRANFAGFTVNCGHRISLSGTNKPHRALARAMKRAQQKTGLTTRWLKVPQTRKEMRREARRLASDPRIGWTEINLTGRKLYLGTSDEELRTASKSVQRTELDIQVRHFQVTGLDAPDLADQ